MKTNRAKGRIYSYSDYTANTTIKAAIDNLRSNIGNMNTGIHSVSAAGPVCGCILFKNTTQYYAAIFFSYFTISYVLFRHSNTTEQIIDIWPVG